MAAEDDEKVKIEAAKIIDLFPTLPRLIVFDLDYTLWPFYCEFYDEDESPSLYPQAKGILYALKDRGIEMAIASRSPAFNVAKAFLNKLGFDSFFVAQEIYSSRTDKTEHFQRIHTRTGIPLQSMLFFDDEYRNIEAVSKMGVTCVWVDRGLNLEALRKGLATFSKKSETLLAFCGLPGFLQPARSGALLLTSKLATQIRVRFCQCLLHCIKLAVRGFIKHLLVPVEFLFYSTLLLTFLFKISLKFQQLIC